MFRLLGVSVVAAAALVLGLGTGHGVAEQRPTTPVATTPPRVADPRPQPAPRPAVVARFVTRYPAGEPRVVNIRRAAELLDGTVLGAGRRFSLNEALGERTEARGFVAAPMISGGRVVDSVGGGISQVATALYNAAFFAGLELVEHTPHSFYIDRYPPGREATVSWGGPELVFVNDWRAPLRMRLRATEAALTVTFISLRLGRRVESTMGRRDAYVEPTTQYVTNGELAPGTENVVQEAGEPGFTVEYGRRVFRYGTLVRDERFRTTYQPKNAIVEVGPRQLGSP